MQKNSPLHVLVIPTWYPNGEDKLIGVYHKLFCTALAEYGVKTNMLYVDRQGLSALPKYPTMQKVYEESNTGYVTYCRRMLDISKFSADAQLSAYCRTIEKLYKAYVKQHGKPDILHAHVTVPPDTPLQSSAKNIIFRSSSRSTPPILSASLRVAPQNTDSMLHGTA